MAYCFTDSDNLNPGRAAYRAARRLIRDNGRAALKWLPLYLGGLMRELLDAKRDYLEVRAEILREWPTANPRQTGDTGTHGLLRHTRLM